MIESWSAAIAPFTVAVLALIVPGAVVVFAGWGARRLAVWFLAPALSLAVLAVEAGGRFSKDDFAKALPSWVGSRSGRRRCSTRAVHHGAERGNAVWTR